MINTTDCKKSSLFKKIDSCEIPDFPKLEPDDLKDITLGSYQMKQSLSYIAQHMYETGLYYLEALKEGDLIRDMFRTKTDLFNVKTWK